MYYRREMKAKAAASSPFPLDYHIPETNSPADRIIYMPLEFTHFLFSDSLVAFDFIHCLF